MLATERAGSCGGGGVMSAINPEAAGSDVTDSDYLFKRIGKHLVEI